MTGSSLVTSIEPIHLFKSATSAEDAYLVDNFIAMIEKMYQYELFKPFLDMSASLIAQKRLKFQITPKERFNLDNGNCKTFEGGALNTFLGKVLLTKKYIITIRQNTPDIIMHEIAHMVEKESALDLSEDFLNSFTDDLQNGDFTKHSIKAAVNRVMNIEVKNYPKDQELAEIFARYFQLLASSHDISGFMTSYSYNIIDFYKAFPKLKSFIESKIQAIIFAKSNQMIVEASKKYIKELSDIEHKWSEEKIHSFHKTKNLDKSPNWSKSVKSIRD